jgi:hypothetical protein
MRKLFVGFILVFVVFSCGKKTPMKPKVTQNKIPIEKIEEMFVNMQSNGVNTDTLMLYGYFFTSDKQDDLKKPVEELKQDGFQYVDIYKSDDTTIWWLHVERIEMHNSQSLFDLDEKLYAIADKYGIYYDGFDVGNADKTKPLSTNSYAVPEEFVTKDYTKNNLPCLLIGNSAFQRFEHKDEFRYFIEVKLKYKTDNETKLPTTNELNDLDKFEYYIEGSLKDDSVRNYYVFRETNNGLRTFYIVTDDKDGANQTMRKIRETGKPRIFDYKIIEDKDWKLYTEFLSKIEEK